MSSMFSFISRAMLDKTRTLQWLHLSWHFSAMGSVTASHILYHHHDTRIWHVRHIMYLYNRTDHSTSLFTVLTTRRHKFTVSKKKKFMSQIMQNSGLIGCEAVMLGWCFLSFPRSVMPSSTRGEESKRNASLQKPHSHKETHCENGFLWNTISKKRVSQKQTLLLTELQCFQTLHPGINMGGSTLTSEVHKRTVHTQSNTQQSDVLA